MCPSSKRFPFPLVFLSPADTQTHTQWAFYSGISSTRLLRVSPGALPIYCHCKGPRLSPPPHHNLHKNIFERLSEGVRDAMATAPTSETSSRFRDQITFLQHLDGEISMETLVTNHILTQFSDLPLDVNGNVHNCDVSAIPGSV